MNLSDKERHSKRRKRNILAKNLWEERQFRPQKRPAKRYKYMTTKEYNRQEWKHDTETELINK